MPPSTSSEYRSYESESGEEEKSKRDPRWLVPIAIIVFGVTYFAVSSPLADPVRFALAGMLITFVFLLSAFCDLCASEGLDRLLGSKKDEKGT